MKYTFMASLAAAVSLAHSAFAQDQLDADGIAELFSNDWIFCTAPEGNSCSWVSQPSLFTRTRGVQGGAGIIEDLGTELIRLEALERFIIVDNSVCFPDSPEYQLERIRIYSTQNRGIEKTGDDVDVTDLNRDMISEMLQLFAEMADGDQLCNRYYMPEQSDQGYDIVIRDYLGNELVEEYGVRLVPESQAHTLELRVE